MLTSKTLRSIVSTTDRKAPMSTAMKTLPDSTAASAKIEYIPA